MLRVIPTREDTLTHEGETLRVPSPCAGSGRDCADNPLDERSNGDLTPLPPLGDDMEQLITVGLAVTDDTYDNKGLGFDFGIGCGRGGFAVDWNVTRETFSAETTLTGTLPFLISDCFSQSEDHGQSTQTAAIFCWQ